MATQAEIRRIDNAQKGTYSIDNHSYPSDLMAPQYGGNYVIFNINVQDDSKLLQSGTAGFEISDDINYTRERGPLLAANLSGKQLVAGAVVGKAVAGALGGGLMSGKIGGALAGGAAAAAPGAIMLGAAADIAASTNRSQKRLKTAIALHIPNQLQIRYGVQWSEEDTSTALMLPLLGEAAIKAIGENNYTGAADSVKTGAAALGLKGGGEGASAMSAATGLAYNPRKEQVFKGVDFRTFQFDYQFFPRDSKESQNVLEIIKAFKLHMQPEFKDENKFLYVYPSEFDITYYANGNENKSIHRHTSCVLTEMSINYTPNGMFNTFADGTPTQINIQLTFRELALMDKDKIMAGY